MASIRLMSGQVSRGSAGEYQADEQAGVAWLSWRLLGRRAGKCRGAQLASIRQMSRYVPGPGQSFSLGSIGETQPSRPPLGKGHPLPTSLKSASQWPQLHLQGLTPEPWTYVQPLALTG